MSECQLNICSTYQKTNNAVLRKINQEAKQMAKEMEIDDSVEEFKNMIF